MMPDAYIVGATRTAVGRKGGRLRDWHPADLAGTVLNELVRQAGVEPMRIDDVILGCVNQIGSQTGNIACYAALAAGLPESVPGTTVDRRCGSSHQALHFAAQAAMSGTMDIVIAGGVESMTTVPIGSPMYIAAEHGMAGRKAPPSGSDTTVSRSTSSQVLNVLPPITGSPGRSWIASAARATKRLLPRSQMASSTPKS